MGGFLVFTFARFVFMVREIHVGVVKSVGPRVVKSLGPREGFWGSRF